MVFQSGPGFRVLWENKAGKSTSYLKHSISPRVLQGSRVEPSRNFSMTSFFLIGNYNSLKEKLFVITSNCQWNFWEIRFLRSTTSFLVRTRQSSSQPANIQQLWHLLEMFMSCPQLGQAATLATLSKRSWSPAIIGGHSPSPSRTCATASPSSERQSPCSHRLETWAHALSLPHWYLSAYNLDKAHVAILKCKSNKKICLSLKNSLYINQATTRQTVSPHWKQQEWPLKAKPPHSPGSRGHSVIQAI